MQGGRLSPATAPGRGCEYTARPSSSQSAPDYGGSGNANGTLLTGWTLTQGTHTTGFHINHPVQKDRAANGQPLPTPTDLFDLPMAGSLEIEVDVPFSLSA